MLIFSYFHFLASQAYLTLAVFVFFRDRKAPLNWLCSCLFLCFFVWSFSFTFIQNPYVSKNTVVIFENIGSLGWLLFSPCFLWFAMHYTKTARSKFHWIFLGLLFSFPIVLFFGQWTDLNLFTDHHLQSYGWICVWKRSILTYLYFAYLFGNLCFSFYLIFVFRRKSNNILIKRQSTLLMISVLIPFILGTISNITLPLLGATMLPPIADIFILTWAIGLTYAVSRYQLLSISPFIAAERIVASMKDLLLLLDTRGTVLSANRSALAKLEYRSEELEGAPVEKILGTGALGGSEDQRLVKSSNIQDYETTFLTKSGAVIPVTLSASLLPGKGIVCVAHDMSLQYLRTEQLENEKNKLKESERMKSLLTGAIVHDIKNHLYSMACDVNAINRISNCPDEARSIIRHTLSACSSGLSLAANMLDIGKMEEGRLVLKKNVVDFSVIQEMLNRYTQNVFFSEKSIAVEVLPPRFSLHFDADHYLLDRILQNLLTNAAMYTPAHGAVNISFAKPAHVRVFNTGEPIPERYRETLFEKYARVTTDSSKYTKGLGLFFCKLVMAAHGGSIGLECSDKGNCFILSFAH
jgi:PAS domain S-box-containing protein